MSYYVVLRFDAERKYAVTIVLGDFAMVGESWKMSYSWYGGGLFTRDFAIRGRLVLFLLSASIFSDSDFDEADDIVAGLIMLVSLFL